MKITKRQLRQIIKEEKTKLLNEQPQVPFDRIIENLHAIADVLESVFGNNDVANDLRAQIDLLAEHSGV